MFDKETEWKKERLPCDDRFASMGESADHRRPEITQANEGVSLRELGRDRVEIANCAIMSPRGDKGDVFLSFLDRVTFQQRDRCQKVEHGDLEDLPLRTEITERHRGDRRVNLNSTFIMHFKCGPVDLGFRDEYSLVYFRERTGCTHTHTHTHTQIKQNAVHDTQAICEYESCFRRVVIAVQLVSLSRPRSWHPAGATGVSRMVV